MKKNQTKSTAMKEKHEKVARKALAKKEDKPKNARSEKAKTSLPKPNKTATLGIKTETAIPDVSFPEGGGNGEIVGKSASSKKRSGKQ